MVKRCYKHKHLPDCRPGRPLCRWMRAKTDKYRVCNCGGYPFPHRRGSGCCNFGSDAAKKQWEYYTGEPWNDDAVPF